MPRLQNQRGDNLARDEAGGAVLRPPEHSMSQPPLFTHLHIYMFTE